MMSLTLYPEQLLYQIVRIYEPNRVVIITKDIIDSAKILINKTYDVNVDNISFDNIKKIVDQIVFNKHQSIISNNTICILNCKEIFSRIETLNDEYSTNEDFNFIGEIYADFI